MENIGLIFMIIGIAAAVLNTILLLAKPFLQHIGILHTDNQRLKLGITMVYLCAGFLFIHGIVCIFSR